MLIRARNRELVRHREWGLLAAVLLALVAWLSGPGSLDRLNHLVQDASMRLQARPGHAGIALIAIDDRSIQAVGRWPWRRALHARLLELVSAQSPRAIGLDILFSEEDPDYPGDDLLLARAIRGSGHVVLPVTRRSHGAGDAADLPLPLFAEGAGQLGHVHVNVDSDGVARGLYLLEGPQSAPWPHFSLAMQCADGTPLPACRGGAAQPATGAWTRARLENIPFAAGATPFATYSYIDVLKGDVPVDAFRDKYVLVGAAATGLGDQFAAPVAPHARRIPGVEMVAHVLSGQLSGVHIQPAPAAWNLAFNLLPVALALLALLLLGPFAALMTSAALFVLTLAAVAFAPLALGWQFAPAAALVGLLLAYPLWSWRRLSAAAHFLRLEMQELQQERLSLRPGGNGAPPSGDFLDRHINAVEHATRQLRELHHFVSDSLRQLPSPTFVCDGEGHVMLANAAAVRYTEALGSGPPHDQPIARLLESLVASDSGETLLPRDVRDMVRVPAQREGRDAQGRSMLMLCKPFAAEAGLGWLVTLVDLTDMRRALQQRDQAMHFISHDIRAPNASILTLLEMQREYPDQMPPAELLTRIERYAQASLAMAESFVRLASAQSHTYRKAPLDLVVLLEETVDDAWAAAQEHGVRVAIDAAPETAPCQGDRSLICRAIANVVSNAIKFSPPGGTVHCTLADRAGHWALAVRDEGPGIAPELQDKLFQPFQRLHEGSHPSVGGIGLGLALVHTVVQRHGGRIEVDSGTGQGTEFRLLLPQDTSQSHPPAPPAL